MLDRNSPYGPTTIQLITHSTSSLQIFHIKDSSKRNRDLNHLLWCQCKSLRMNRSLCTNIGALFEQITDRMNSAVSLNHVDRTRRVSQSTTLLSLLKDISKVRSGRTNGERALHHVSKSLVIRNGNKRRYGPEWNQNKTNFSDLSWDRNKTDNVHVQ